ncbi:histidine kinase [Flavisolibacter sp. BT320]|nr:histidine kinase [Flavisolibacter longurius]
MNRINRIFTAVHIFPWTVYAGAVFWDILVCGSAFRPNVYLGVLLLGLYVFYCHFFILTKYLNKRKYRAYFLGLIPILLTGPFPFLLFISRADDPYREEAPSMAVAAMAAFLVLSFLVRITQNLIINIIKREQSKKQAINTELVYLKTQINPHFLFNTLNNIHTLVYTQSASAPDAVMRLSSLMRYMLYESNAATVPLSTEIDYLKDYIALQQLRYKLSPVVDFHIEGSIESCHVAPLLFIHLLENAYKHSPARLEAGSIKVKITVTENELFFTVQNPVANKRDDSLEEPGGIGLTNVQKRLQLLYPNRHHLEINQNEDIFTVALKITGIQKGVNDRKADLLYH